MPDALRPDAIHTTNPLFPIVCRPWAASAEVRVWQGTLALPTYEEGPPDPNPPFDQFATDRFNYPYTLRNNLTGPPR